MRNTKRNGRLSLIRFDPTGISGVSHQIAVLSIDWRME